MDLITEFRFDSKYRVSTSMIIPADQLNFQDEIVQKEAVRYRPSPPYRVECAIEALKKHQPDIVNHAFVDFGCGAGRVMIIAAEAGFNEIVGVELSPQLIALCRKNLDNYSRLNNTSRFNVIKKSAAEYIIPYDACCFYFYQPFSAEIYHAVMQRIKNSLRFYPRRMYILELASDYDFLSDGCQLLYSGGINLYELTDPVETVEHAKNAKKPSTRAPLNPSTPAGGDSTIPNA